MSPNRLHSASVAKDFEDGDEHENDDHTWNQGLKDRFPKENLVLPTINKDAVRLIGLEQSREQSFLSL